MLQLEKFLEKYNNTFQENIFKHVGPSLVGKEWPDPLKWMIILYSTFFIQSRMNWQSWWQNENWTRPPRSLQYLRFRICSYKLSLIVLKTARLHLLLMDLRNQVRIPDCRKYSFFYVPPNFFDYVDFGPPWKLNAR